MSLSELSLNADLMDTLGNVFASYGSDIRRYKMAFMKRRLDRRMRILEINDYSEYASILRKERHEFDELVTSLSINVTSFFRDFMVYDKFKSHIIPKILSSLKQKEKIRVWSAGCASGEEAYSLAILFEHVVGKNFSVEIIASDVNKKAIEYAQNGIYPEKSIEKLPREFIINNFHKINNSDNSVEYQVASHIKKLVTFQVGDILSNRVTQVDVIFCRNVLIYYEKETQELIMEKFNHCLKDAGYIALGMDETMLGRRCEKLFYPLMPRERIYQKAVMTNS